MAGYTDSAFRLVCKQMGADVVYSEMISVDGICFKNQKTLKMLEFNKKECPVIFQLFGSKPENFAKAIQIINSKFPNFQIPKLPIGIDINFGCPARKVAKTGSGAALMNELDKAYEIIKTVCDNTSLPISVKIRTKVKNTTCLDFVEKIKNLPISAIMIHGRTLNQGFTGEIDYEIIQKVKQILPEKIIIANGDVNIQSDISNILKKTQADGLGIARGALGNPWIFKQQVPSLAQKRQVILKHAQLFLKNNQNLIPLRKHLVHYAKGQKNASALRQRIIRVKTFDDLKKILIKN